MKVDERYTSSLALHLQKQCEEHILEVKENLRKSDIIKNQSQEYWLKVKDWISGAIKQVNESSEQRVIDCQGNSNRLIISQKCISSFEDILTVVFDSSNGSITCSGQGQGMCFRPSVHGNDLIYLEEGQQVCDPHELGMAIMNLATGYIDPVFAKLGRQP